MNLNLAHNLSYYIKGKRIRTAMRHFGWQIPLCTSLELWNVE